MRSFLILLLLITLGACGEPKVTTPYHGIDVSWQHPHADFQLTDFDGKPRSLLDFRGKVVALFFGYTHCPEVCPTTLADLAQVMQLLGNDANRVQVLFVTLDPERDNPELLKKFVPSFNSAFLGLYGNTQNTTQAAKSFGVNFEKHDDHHGGYTLDHSDGIYMLGIKGEPLLLSPYGQRAEFLAQDIKLLLDTNK